MKTKRLFVGLAATGLALTTLTGCSSDDVDESCERLDEMLDEHDEVFYTLDVQNPQDSADELDELASEVKDIQSNAGDDDMSDNLDLFVPVFEMYADLGNEDIEQEEMFESFEEDFDDEEMTEASEYFEDTCDVVF